MRKYSEFDYARLMFAPGGIYDYMKERRGWFESKFNVSLSYDGLVKAIAASKEADRIKISSGQLLVKISGVYNKVSQGMAQPTAKFGSAPHTKLVEIIQVFALDDERSFKGLKEHIEKFDGGNFRPLLQEATESYQVEVRNIVGLAKIGDLIQALGAQTTAQYKDLKKVLATKQQEEAALQEILIKVADQIRGELKKYPDSPLKQKMNEFVKKLESSIIDEINHL